MLPAPGFLEEATDCPRTGKRSEALLKSPAGVKSAIVFLGGVLPEAKPVESATLPLTCRLAEWPKSEASENAQSGWAAGWTPAVLAPLATKLYQESKLMPAGGERRKA